MARPRPIPSSSIGRKAVMAASGLLLGLFLLTHMAGNSTMFLGRAAFESYAEHLHAFGPLLKLVEILLAVAFALHIGYGTWLFVANRQARPVGYLGRPAAQGRNPASRTMFYSGSAVLCFLLLHLAQFHFRDDTLPLADLVRTTFGQAPFALFYLLGAGAAALHTSHGFWSFFQTLGLSHPRYDPFLQRAALAAAIGVGAVFGLIPCLGYFSVIFLR